MKAQKKKQTAKKSVTKKTAKKVVQKTVKKVAGKPARKAEKVLPKNVKKQTGHRLFAAELQWLDIAQKDLFNAIAEKPHNNEYEDIRLYVDNTYMILNRVVTIIMEVKNSLLKKDLPTEITETYNSPA